MQAELLTIGSEILSGSTLDTNSAWISQRLLGLGITVVRRTSVPDDPSLLVPAIQEAMGRSRLILTTGGLGPTADDITLAAVADATDRPLILHPEIAAAIRRFYSRRRRRLQQDALRQAYLPQGASALANPLGTAPGVWLEMDSSLIISLPGVPMEMRALMEHAILPRLSRLKGRPCVASIVLRTAGLVELELQHLMEKIGVPANVQVGYYPHLRAVDLRLSATARTPAAAEKQIRSLCSQLRKALGPAIYAADEEKMESIIGRLLVKRRRTLGVAESCTGGLVCARLTDVPGSSRYFRGGAIVYANELKTCLLGVSDAVLKKYGAVSGQTAAAMASGVRRATESSIGLSITGIAGPGGGSASKPVGLVYIGLADGKNARTERHQFFGSREMIKGQAAQMALNALRLHLLGAPSSHPPATR